MLQSTETTGSITLEQRIETVRERIELACQRSGRSSRDVTLIGVTKTFPAHIVEAAVEAGLTHIGENRVQELVEKAAGLLGRRQGGEVTWHMIGHLQRNKARYVVEYADCFHALDSWRLAVELDKRAGQGGRIVPCLVQTNVSKEQSKFGIAPSDLHAFLDSLSQFEHLQIDGLMTIASFVDDPEEVRSEFRRLRELFETYDARDHPRIVMRRLSMGMSGDFEVAVEEGATDVRIGSAIFGARG